MPALTEKPGANLTAPNGSIIMDQGTDASHLVILQQGKVSLRSAAVDSDGQIDASKSKYLFTISAPAILGGAGLTTGNSTSYSVIAETDAVVSVYPMNQSQLAKTFQSKPNIAIVYLKSIVREVLEIQKKNIHISNALEQLKNFENSTILGYSEVNPDPFKNDAQDTGFSDSVIEMATEILERYRENGGQIIRPLNRQFLESDHANELDDGMLGDLTDIEDDLAIVRKFTALSPQILGAIAKSDPALFLSFGSKLAKFLESFLLEADTQFHRMNQIIERLLKDQNSWLEKISLQCELFEQRVIAADEKSVIALTEYFENHLRIAMNEFSRAWAMPLPEYNKASLEKIKTFVQKALSSVEVAPVPGEKAAQTASLSVSSGFAEEVKDSMRKIVEYSGLEQDKFATLVGAINNLKGLKTPFDGDDSARKLRRQASMIFWEIYEKVALRLLSQRETPTRLHEMFLNFGMLDETFMDEEQLQFIYENAGRQTSKYPLHTPLEWLTKIYNKEVPTSINELGASFLDILRQDPDNRGQKWKKLTDLPANLYTSEALLKWEVHNFMFPNSRVTSGSPMTYLAILTRYHINQNIENSLLTKQKIEEEIDFVLERDFGAFHREVLYTNEEKGINREFVRKQIAPNIILTPTAGSKMQFWQDREGNDRFSPGRIACPHIAAGDFTNMLHKVIAIHRWETVKTTMGPDWNNISVNSLTSEYTDYVQFFHKNRELSPELKEKIATEMKRFREDRERFANDYTIWLKYESEGVQRMNKVARRLFCKHVPFSKAIREKLVRQPAFADFIEKSNNIHKKKARELQPRYTKYERDNGSLPDELLDTLKYFNLQY
ncbi:MAG: cyclic nucleotide-binding domain-containing protein [Leptospiraceae bacterium]|nr:cyclic nucleotide-binding domain-containing protein [Leptospiraceae bacterium]